MGLEEQIMSEDKYPSIFSRQMEAIVYTFSHQMEAIIVIGLFVQCDCPGEGSSEKNCCWVTEVSTTRSSSESSEYCRSVERDWSKRQSSITVLFRTTLSLKITLYRGFCVLSKGLREIVFQPFNPQRGLPLTSKIVWR